jgi:hypothetical protein
MHNNVIGPQAVQNLMNRRAIDGFVTGCTEGEILDFATWM